MFSKIKTISNKLLAIGIIAAVLIVALISLDFYQTAKQKEGLSESQLLKVPKEKIIDYKLQAAENSNGPEENSNTIVKYRYISSKEVPAETYQGLKEDMSKRTKSSQAFLKSIKPISEELQQEEYVAKFYSGQAFQKDGDKWYYVETATTTPQAFSSQIRLTLLDQVKEFFGQKVLADTIYSGAGDGYVYEEGGANSTVNQAWDNAHDVADGYFADYTPSATASFGIYFYDSVSGGRNAFDIYKMFLPFDTSAIPSDATIISATLNVYVTTKVNTKNDGYDIVIVLQSTQANSATLVTSDYNEAGATTTISTNWDVPDITDITTSAYLTMNASSFSEIKRSGETSSCGTETGYTCLALREFHDPFNTHNTVDDEGNWNNLVTIRTSEYADITYDPYLAITYTGPPTLIKIDGGTVKIDGGTVKID